jgi:glutaminase
MHSSFSDYLESLHQQFSALNEGAVADYIPELTRVDPDWFGIAVATLDGKVYQVGDSRQPFTIQSISKAFIYGLALQDQGAERVLSKIDVEPSGEAFNSISLEEDTGRPRNPMINAGAIVATSLVKDRGPGGRIDRILKYFADYCGHEVDIDQAVYVSERDTGHRNRAISHLLRNYEILEGDPEPALDDYFKQCSMLVNCRDLALMGATLANDGVNPITGVRALESRHLPRVLSVMATCGMYDYSGNWIYSVGMPAKSGVGGGIVAVLPGQLGLAVFSPRLDAKGNSVRGIKVCEAISREFGLHMLRATRTTGASVIRHRYDLSEVRSKLQRPPARSQALDELGRQAQVFELNGELGLISAEIVCTEVSRGLDRHPYTLVDLRRVDSIDHSAIQLLANLTKSLGQQQRHLLITGYRNLHGMERQLKRRLEPELHGPLLAHVKLDDAVEWCEEQLLAQGGCGDTPTDQIELREQPLCKGFVAEQLTLLEELLEQETFPAGEAIIREGELADKVYLVQRGRVSTWIKNGSATPHRLFATVAGWTFGEAALFDGKAKRTADVIADTDVTLLSFRVEQLYAIDKPEAAELRARLFRNLSEISIERLKQANAEIRSLSA